MKTKYTCITKVNKDKYVKHHVDNFVSFERYLDKEFAGWLYYRIYNSETKEYIKSISHKNRPTNNRHLLQNL